MEIINLYYFCSWTATVTYLFAVAVLFLKKFHSTFKYLGFYLGILFLLDIIFWIISWTKLVDFFDRNTLFSFHLSTLCGIVFWCLFFNTVFEKKHQNWFIVSALIMFLTLVVDGLYFSTFKKINTYSSAIFYIWALIVTGIAFEKLIRERRQASIRREPLFWIYMGFIISQTANAIHNISANVLIESRSNSYLVMVCFTCLVNIFANILYTKGCYEIR